MTLPNILSCSRYLLAIAIAYLVWREHWVGAAIILWLAVFSDMADGYIARKRNQTTVLGGLLDHSADAFFVTLLLLSLANHGIIPIFLPLLVVAAFLQYTFDSRALSGRPLRTSSLGRYNGISYYLMGGLPVMQSALEIALVPDAAIPWIAWGLVITTAISMIDRLVSLITTADSGRPVDK